MVRYFYCLRIARVGSTWQCLRRRHEPKLPFISKLIIHVHHQQQKNPTINEYRVGFDKKIVQRGASDQNLLDNNGIGEICFVHPFFVRFFTQIELGSKLQLQEIHLPVLLTICVRLTTLYTSPTSKAPKRLLPTRNG